MRCTYYFFSVVLNLLVYSYLAQRLGMFFALCASTRLGPMLVRVLCGGIVMDQHNSSMLTNKSGIWAISRLRSSRMTNKSGIWAILRLRSSPAAGEQRAMMKAMMKVVLKVRVGVAMAVENWFFGRAARKIIFEGRWPSEIRAVC